MGKQEGNSWRLSCKKQGLRLAGCLWKIELWRGVSARAGTIMDGEQSSRICPQSKRYVVVLFRG